MRKKKQHLWNARKTTRRERENRTFSLPIRSTTMLFKSCSLFNWILLATVSLCLLLFMRETTKCCWWFCALLIYIFLFEIDAVFPDEKCVLNRDPVHAVASILCIECMIVRSKISFAKAYCYTRSSSSKALPTAKFFFVQVKFLPFCSILKKTKKGGWNKGGKASKFLSLWPTHPSKRRRRRSEKRILHTYKNNKNDERGWFIPRFRFGKDGEPGGDQEGV